MSDRRVREEDVIRIAYMVKAGEITKDEAKDMVDALAFDRAESR